MVVVLHVFTVVAILAVGQFGAYSAISTQPLTSASHHLGLILLCCCSAVCCLQGRRGAAAHRLGPDRLQGGASGGWPLLCVPPRAGLLPQVQWRRRHQHRRCWCVGQPHIVVSASVALAAAGAAACDPWKLTPSGAAPAPTSPPPAAAAPTVLCCVITAKTCGVRAYGSSAPRLEQCSIEQCGEQGLKAMEHAAPVLHG